MTDRWRKVWRTLAVLTVAGVALVTVETSAAHNERQLHRALNRLDARIDAQANRIDRLTTRVTNLREVVDSDFVLLSCALDATWDALNSEGALTLTYPNLEACDAAAARSLNTKAASMRMALERMH